MIACIVPTYVVSILAIWSLCKLQLTDIEYKLKERKRAPHLCHLCKAVKRPDIKHCLRCDCCVEGHDHHCDVFGLCIGQPNHKFFIQFFIHSGLFVGLCGISYFIYSTSILFNPEQYDQSFELDISGLVVLVVTGIGCVILIILGVCFLKMGVRS